MTTKSNPKVGSKVTRRNGERGRIAEVHLTHVTWAHPKDHVVVHWYNGKTQAITMRGLARMTVTE